MWFQMIDKSNEIRKLLSVMAKMVIDLDDQNKVDSFGNYEIIHIFNLFILYRLK